MKILRFRNWTVPLALLILCVLSFGLLIPWLGFYWDDWPVILMTRLQGARGFWAFYQYDRPFSAWTYILSAPLLGTAPLGWHLFTLALRWLTVLGMWWSLRGLWPRHPRPVTWMAVLFAIYPVFNQQPIAVAFSQHWTCYALYFLSLGAMIQAVRQPARRGRWTILALLTSILHLLTMEYFFGLELLRPLVLWFLNDQEAGSRRQRLLTSLRQWLPYLAILVGYAIWRLFFLHLAGADPNSPELLGELLRHPLTAGSGLVQLVLQDLAFILVTAWYPTFQPDMFNLSDRFAWLALGIGIVSAISLGIYLLRLPPDQLDEEDSPALNSSSTMDWRQQVFILGVAALLLGPLPVWLTGRQALHGLYGDRFALAAMFGASLLVIAVIDWLTPRRSAQIVLLSVLVGLGVAFHLRSTNDFRWIWTKQSRFYWQLAWRAPQLMPGTAILSAGELFKYVGDYSTTAGLNLLYPVSAPDGAMPYWFLDLESNFTNRTDMVAGLDFQRKFRSFSFQGSTLNSLVIDYNPEAGRCLRVLDPNQSDNPEYAELARQARPISNLERILPSAGPAGYPPTSIFGPEPEHTWCYYYEKAELARQQSDWKLIAQLGDQAQKAGHQPNDAWEWLPFIEGYARSGQLKAAQQLSQQAVSVIPRMAPPICQLWQSFVLDQPGTPGLASTAEKVSAQLNCSP